MSGSSHFDRHGNARMVDVTAKEATDRTATATATVVMQPETLSLILAGTVGKGDVLGTARLAGIMAAKRTPGLIPLCHPVALSAVSVDLTVDRERAAVDITARCRCRGPTGVEMEALTAATLAALTVYDMCKATDRGIRITDVRLVHKAGGKSGTYDAD